MINLDSNELAFIEAAVSMYYKDMHKYTEYFDSEPGDVEAVHALLVKLHGFLNTLKAPDNPETE